MSQDSNLHHEQQNFNYLISSNNLNDINDNSAKWIRKYFERNTTNSAELIRNLVFNNFEWLNMGRPIIVDILTNKQVDSNTRNEIISYLGEVKWNSFDFDWVKVFEMIYKSKSERSTLRTSSLLAIFSLCGISLLEVIKTNEQLILELKDFDFEKLNPLIIQIKNKFPEIEIV